MTAVDERLPLQPGCAVGPGTHDVALPGGSRGLGLLQKATRGLAPVGLAELNASAELLTRVDNKYLVPLEDVGLFIAGLHRRVAEADGAHAGGLAVLTIDGQRTFDYESVYFDTDELTLFRHHLQGRRRRYKVRTRTYLSSKLCMFEVKLKGARGETVKERVRHCFDDRARLGPDDTSFLQDLLQERYAVDPLPLSAQVTTLYRRTTLLDRAAAERVTCDADLTCGGARGSVRADGHVVVETKSATGRGRADAVLRDLGLRPVRLSKYCMAVALLDPSLPASPWQRTLRHHYGWQRAA